MFLYMIESDVRMFWVDRLIYWISIRYKAYCK